jgi:hypothetical protein
MDVDALENSNGRQSRYQRNAAQPHVPPLRHGAGGCQPLLINYVFSIEIYRLIWLLFELRGSASTSAKPGTS